MRPQVLSKLMGCLFLATAVVIALVIRCPTNIQYFILYALTGLGIALLFVKSAERSTLHLRRWNIGVGLSGAVVLPFVLFFTNPIGRFRSDVCSIGQNITVFVHGKKGRQDIILRQKGYVLLDVGSERKRAPIDENGEAHFQNLRTGDPVQLNIDFSEPYKAVRPDSIYIIDEHDVIYLPVYLRGGNLVKGNILYDDAPLAGVTVNIINVTGRTSDSLGFFSLEIPDSLQSDSYKIWFNKPGFIAQSVIAYPQTDLPLTIIMRKANH